jgi:hypothetical protein
VAIHRKIEVAVAKFASASGGYLMSKDSGVPTQGIREKHLNIVYFVDSSKSHSLRINFAVARWIVALAVGVFLWSIISVVWIISLDRTVEMSRQHMASVLNSLFDYQVKCDNVFETAYPESQTHGYYAKGSHLPSNNPVSSPKDGASSEMAQLQQRNTTNSGDAPRPMQSDSQKMASSGDPTSSLTSTKSPDSNKDKLVPATALAGQTGVQASVESGTKTGAVSSDGSGLNIDITNTMLSAGSGKMTLLFDISNKDGKRKAEGYIWATGVIQLADGSTKKIAAPAHSQIDNEGNIAAYTSTYKFSIQRFKKKDFMFTVPSENTWKLTELKVTYVDPKGKNRTSKQISTAVKFLPVKTSAIETAPSLEKSNNGSTTGGQMQ